MSFGMLIPPVPGGNHGAMQLWLEGLRQRLNFLTNRLDAPGCGLEEDDGALSVLHDGTLTCDPTTGLRVTVPAITDHGGLTGLTDDDHPQYLKTKDEGGTAIEIPLHDHTSDDEGSRLDHGSAMTGLGDDDHTQYLHTAPGAGRNLVTNGAATAHGLKILAHASQSVDVLRIADSADAAKAGVTSAFLGYSEDYDTAFSDPNSHFQVSNDSLNALIEEVGYVVKEQTRAWPHLPLHSRWWEGATYTYIAGSDMFGAGCADGSSVTIAYITTKIPVWYQKSGSNVYTVEVLYSISASPGSDLVWRYEIKHRTFDAGDSSFGSYTTTTKDETVASGATASAPRRFTLDVTAGDFASGDEYVHFAIRRLGSHANDTYTGTIYIHGMTISSGIKST